MHDIIIKAMIDQSDYNTINRLKEICSKHDGTCLKLELDYKLKSDNQSGINEFLYYIEKVLVAYIGIVQFGGGDLELNGMVHPDYRRLGLFKTLFDKAINECRKRDGNILLLSDFESKSGTSFIEKNLGVFDLSEFEMYLKNSLIKPKGEVTLEKATNKDAMEVYDQNLIYFSDLHEGDCNKSIVMPEEEAKKGVTTYLAYVKRGIIGKVHLTVDNNLGAIYGLGVKPEYRRKGYGREILLESIKILQRELSQDVMLQVVSSNKKALDLYESCGFEIVSRMSYYKFS